MQKISGLRAELLALAISLSISLLSIWISGQSVLATPKEFGLAILSVFQGAFSSSANFVGKSLSSISKLSDLQREYDILVDRLQELENSQGDIISLTEENRRLKDVLLFSSQLNQKNFAAQIIGKESGVYFNSLTINKGFNHGVRKGMPVLAVQDGIQALVGKISEVSISSSLVEPLFSSNMYVGVRFEGARYDGLVKGSGMSSEPLLLQYVDSEAIGKVGIGEPVVTSGLNSRYPAGILLGHVQAIHAKTFESTLEFDIKPAISFARLEYVFVLSLESTTL